MSLYTQLETIADDFALMPSFSDDVEPWTPKPLTFNQPFSIVQKDTDLQFQGFAKPEQPEHHAPQSRENIVSSLYGTSQNAPGHAKYGPDEGS